MAVSAKLFGLALRSAFNAEIDWDSHSIKVMLCSSGYTPDQDTHRYKSHVSNEVTGTGYTAGGVALANLTVAYDGATNTLKLDADDIAWTGATFTSRYAIVYDDTPATDAAKPLIAYVDFGADQPVSAGTFTINWSASGIATLTAA